MNQLVLAGKDSRIVPLLTRLRTESKMAVAALACSGADSVAALYADIAGLPLVKSVEDPVLSSADHIISDGSIPWLSAKKKTVISIEEARRRWLPERQDRAPAQAPPLTSFAAEVNREVVRSRRYHLGFCLSMFMIVSPSGKALPSALLEKPPFDDLPRRLGRGTDTWGISPEGVILHLAPETHEQARLLRKRLVEDIGKLAAQLPAADWKVRAAQALFPRDGETAPELVSAASGRLARALVAGKQK